MNQPNVKKNNAPDTDNTARAVAPPPPCQDPRNDHDRWVLWLMLEQPLDRCCHTLMAALLAESYRGPDGGPGLVWESGEWWQYNPNTGAWSVLPRFRVEQRLNLWSGHLVAVGDKVRPLTLSKRDKASILACLETETTPPRSVFDNARRGIAFRNGFLDVLFNLGPNDPENFAQWSLDCDYYPLQELTDAGRFDGSLFKKFWAASGLSQDKINLIGQHMFSALAGLGTTYGRALLLIGARGAGKSQVLAMYEALVPPDAVTNVTPQQLESDYHGACLRGKALNVCYELSAVNPIPDEAGIKSIIQGERITRRPIRQAPISFKPTAAHAFATNEHLQINAPSAAFFDRWALVGFEKTIRGTSHAVLNIGQRVAREELGLLVSWVVDCGRSLVQRGRYSLTDEHHELVAEWKRQGDSVAAWLSDDTLDVASEPATTWWTITQAFDRFVGWARSGQFPITNKREFRRRLIAHGVTVTRSNGTRVSLRRGES